MKRLWFTSVALAAVIGLVSVVAPTAEAATSTTCNWAGVQGTDNKFSTSTNWSCSGVTIPDHTTAVTIDMNLLTEGQALINDLQGAIGSLEITDSETTATYRNASVDTVGLIHGGTITRKTENDFMSIGSVTSAGSIVMNYSSPATYPLNAAAYDVAGSVTMDGGSIHITSVKNNSQIILEGGAVLYAQAYYSSLNYANDITVNKGSVTVSDYCKFVDGKCSGYVESKVTFSGVVTLNSDTPLYIGKKGYASLDLTKETAGSGKFVFEPMSEGDLAVAGVKQPYPTKQTIIKSVTDCTTDPKGSIIVARNDSATLDNATVTNGRVVIDGVLKGNGKFVHCVYSATDSWGGFLVVNAGAVIAPGNSPGVITADSFSLDGEYQFQFGGDNPGTGYDQIVVTNYVDTTTTPDEIVVTLGPTSRISTERLGSYTPARGKVFTVIDNQSKNAVSGTFSGLPEGATFEQNGIVFRVSYVGGTGNDVTLTVMNTPIAPDTGFALVQSNPAFTGLVALLAGVALLVLGRKLQPTRR